MRERTEYVAPGTDEGRAAPFAHAPRTEQQDEGQFSPVFVFGHDYGAHHHGCDVLELPASDNCTCGFGEAFEAALASERRT